MRLKLSRRAFMRQAALATSALSAGGLAPRRAAAAPRSPNERLNLGVIGVANRGAKNLEGVSGENIVALCDIDQRHLGAAADTFPHAARYTDFRKMLDEAKLDAVVVSTPDHTHAVAAAGALRRGLDVYCEKPLAHSVREVRLLRQLAAQQKAVTQMGTQIHAGDNYRRVVEIVRSRLLGDIGRVHVWHVGEVRPGVRVASGSPPRDVDYELWTGPAPMRPFHESHFHFNWRYWWDFGNGALGDFGCHYMDLPFWALDLKDPITIQASGEKTYIGDNEPPDSMRVDYHFAARGELAPVQLTWYHGGARPDWIMDYGKNSGVLFEGANGRLLADYRENKLFVEPSLDGETPPPSIPASIGHHAEWIEAVKTRGPTTCDFDYSGALAEAVLLGNVSYRAGGAKLDWDADNMTIGGAPHAEQFLFREYRAGWEL